MILGAMQPYLFPYLGYYQLMDAADIYLFCGNVQYMKHSWINRNRIYTNVKKGEVSYFTFSVAKDNYEKCINERYYSNLKEDCEKLKRNLYQTYRYAVNFEEAYSVIETALEFDNNNVAYFNMNANHTIAKYMGICSKITCTDIVEDGSFWNNFYMLDYEDRMIYICKYFGADSYYNAIGGTDLYHKEKFLREGIGLGFIRMSEHINYPQWDKAFISNLSIIDVIMHNHRDEIKNLLKQYVII